MAISILKYRHGSNVEEILLRDKYACVFCQSTNNLNIDHIIPVKQGGRSTIENQRTLCQSCHSRLTKSKPKHELTKIGLYLREWRSKNPDYNTQYHKLWRKNHPGYFNKYSKGKYASYKESI